MISANYIDEIDPAVPDGATEKVSALDDYIRMLSRVLTNQFPNFTGIPVTASEANLNAAAAIAIAAASNGGVVYAQPSIDAGGFVYENRIGAANGVAGLDGTGKVPVAQLPDLDYLAGPSGTVMLFGQAAAPTGWTAITFFDDYAMRLTNPASYVGGQNLSSPGFSSRFASGRFTTGLTGQTEVPSTPNSVFVATNNHNHTIDMDVKYVDFIPATRD